MFPPVPQDMVKVLQAVDSVNHLGDFLFMTNEEKSLKMKLDVFKGGIRSLVLEWMKEAEVCGTTTQKYRRFHAKELLRRITELEFEIEKINYKEVD